MQLKNKVEVFKEDTKTKCTLQLTMITTYGIKRNKYSNYISKQICMEDLFVCSKWQNSLGVHGLRKKCLHFLDLCIIILCKAMKEKSRYMDVFRECPAGARTWRIYIEYVPEPLPEMFSRDRRVRPILRKVCDGTWWGVFCEKHLNRSGTADFSPSVP